MQKRGSETRLSLVKREMARGSISISGLECLRQNMSGGGYQFAHIIFVQGNENRTSRLRSRLVLKKSFCVLLRELSSSDL